ncbi:hypothetical protein JCM10207_005029 [Rhodosporidiobolus poonsookiae]
MPADKSRSRRGSAAGPSGHTTKHKSCEGCRSRKMRCSRTANCTNCIAREIPCVWAGSAPSRSSEDATIEEQGREIYRLNMLVARLQARIEELGGNSADIPRKASIASSTCSTSSVSALSSVDASDVPVDSPRDSAPNSPFSRRGSSATSAPSILFSPPPPAQQSLVEPQPSRPVPRLRISTASPAFASPATVSRDRTRSAPPTSYTFLQPSCTPPTPQEAILANPLPAATRPPPASLAFVDRNPYPSFPHFIPPPPIPGASANPPASVDRTPPLQPVAEAASPPLSFAPPAPPPDRRPSSSPDRAFADLDCTDVFGTLSFLAPQAFEHMRARASPVGWQT